MGWQKADEELKLIKWDAILFVWAHVLWEWHAHRARETFLSLVIVLCVNLSGQLFNLNTNLDVAVDTCFVDVVTLSNKDDPQ
jgi:hypothetical protein